MAASSMRGLSVFISDIRNCQNKEQERARVDKELANIRSHFKSDRALTAYEKKKYVWKLLYIYMLGYEVEFGMIEATSLISAPKYAEKQVGYVVTSCLLNENTDFLRLVINTVRNDILSRNDTFQCLALTLIGNLGGKEFAEAVSQDVQKLLLTSSLRPLVKKKAALCLLRLFRKSPEVFSSDLWADKMLALLEERDLGVLLAVVSLFVALVASDPEAYTGCIPKCVRILDRLIRVVDIPQDYTYYGIPSPWLQVKVMRALQYFPAIEDPALRKALMEIIVQILQKSDTVKNVNKNNAIHAILFETMGLAMHMDVEYDILGQCVGQLGKFIGVREPNIRYLGLENMSRMLIVSDVQGSIRMHQAQIVGSLKDPDISIRRRALDLLYGMCDVENAKDIVEELLQYLTNAEFAIREELTLKCAVLAERFAPNLSWYVDVILSLIEKAGDFVSDDIWYRVVHFVTNNDDLQVHAAAKVMDHLRLPGVHETMVKVAGYILGEFGPLLATAEGPERATQGQVFDTLLDKFPAVSVPTKALLLSAFIKILLRAPPSDTELHAKALAVFTRYSGFVDAELQQRAVEYSVMAQRGQALADIMAPMPPFPERESALVKKAEDNEGDAAEVSAVKARLQLAQSQAIILVPKQGHGVPSVGPIKTPLTPSEPNGAPLPSASSEAEVSSAPPPSDPTALAAAAAPSPPSTQAVGDLLGELLLLDAPPPAQPAASSGAASPAFGAASADPNLMALALLDGAGPAPGSAPPPVQPIGSVAEWFRALLVKDSGVLYEDPHVQIGVKAEWSGPHGRVVLFVGNKGTAPLTAVQASVGPTPGLRVMPAAAPPVIPPRAQIQVPVEAAAVLAPKEVPILNLSYTVGQLTVPLRLHLPVLLSKFMQPASLPAADFFGRWKAFASPPQKLQEVVPGVKPVPLATMAQTLTSFKISVLPNLDPNPNNLVACCTLFTETLPPVLLLTRIETDPGDRTQMRLTVASSEPTATLALKEFIKEQLSEAGPGWLQQTTAPSAAPPAPALLALPSTVPSPAPLPPSSIPGQSTPSVPPYGTPQPQPQPYATAPHPGSAPPPYGAVTPSMGAGPGGYQGYAMPQQPGGIGGYGQAPPIMGQQQPGGIVGYPGGVPGGGQAPPGYSPYGPPGGLI